MAEVEISLSYHRMKGNILVTPRPWTGRIYLPLLEGQDEYDAEYVEAAAPDYSRAENKNTGWQTVFWVLEDYIRAMRTRCDKCGRHDG